LASIALLLLGATMALRLRQGQPFEAERQPALAA
jgi:hypothetical protein